MFILITILLLFAAALALAILQAAQPGYRFAWLIAAGGSFLAWAGVLLWQARMPMKWGLPAWGSSALFADAPAFAADRIAWPYALALSALALAVVLSAAARENFPAPFSWAGALTLAGLGLLAALADNPLTLALVWAAIDLAELVTQLAAPQEEGASGRIVAGFAARLLGIGFLLWAGLTSEARNIPLDFQTTLPQAGIFLILAAGLRLGVLPLHLGFAAASAERRGFGTTIRIVSAVSSLVILARIPTQGIASPLVPFLLALASLAGLYAAWMWMRSPDEIAGRPYWIVGFAALALAAALRGSPVASVAWGATLALLGSALFLSSIQHKFIGRVLLAVGLWSISALPFSPTARGWESSAPSTWATWLMWPSLLLAQALLAAGFIRHATRPASFAPLDPEKAWARNIYPIGIGLPLACLLLLGIFGWDGARSLGSPLAGLLAGALTLALLWLTPRVRWLNPMRAHWVRPQQAAPRPPGAFSEILSSLYRALGRLAESVAAVLEGEGGILWALLFLVLLISLLASRQP